MPGKNVSPVLGAMASEERNSLPRIHANFREQTKKFVPIREIRG
jgi:hypothetical protein